MVRLQIETYTTTLHHNCYCWHPPHKDNCFNRPITGSFSALNANTQIPWHSLEVHIHLFHIIMHGTYAYMVLQSRIRFSRRQPTTVYVSVSDHFNLSHRARDHHRNCCLWYATTYDPTTKSWCSTNMYYMCTCTYVAFCCVCWSFVHLHWHTHAILQHCTIIVNGPERRTDTLKSGKFSNKLPDCSANKIAQNANTEQWWRWRCQKRLASKLWWWLIMTRSLEVVAEFANGVGLPNWIVTKAFASGQRCAVIDCVFISGESIGLLACWLTGASSTSLRSSLRNCLRSLAIELKCTHAQNARNKPPHH